MLRPASVGEPSDPRHLRGGLKGGGRRPGPTLLAPPAAFRDKGQSRALEDSAPRAGALQPGLVLVPWPLTSSSPRPRSFPWVLPGLPVSPPRSALDPLVQSSARPSTAWRPCLLISPVWQWRSPSPCLVLSLLTACRVSRASLVAPQPDLGPQLPPGSPGNVFKPPPLFSDCCPTSSRSLSANGLASRFLRK